MPTVGRINRQILVVKVQNHFFHFEAELLVQTYGRVRSGNMQRYVLSHARLRQVVEHEGSDASALPSSPDGHERDVRIVVADVRYEESASDDQTFVEGNDAELGIGEAFGHWNLTNWFHFILENRNCCVDFGVFTVDAWPEGFLQETINRSYMMWSNVAIVNGCSFRHSSVDGVLQFNHELQYISKFTLCLFS